MIDKYINLIYNAYIRLIYLRWIEYEKTKYQKIMDDHILAVVSCYAVLF